MTNLNLINKLLNKQAKKQTLNNLYGARHATRWDDSTIGKMTNALALYADEFNKNNPDYSLSQDNILGTAWANILSNIRTLLNGDIGSLDGGCCDEILLELAKNNGFEENDL